MVHKIKDPISGLTHLAGALLSVAGLLVLVIPAYQQGQWVKFISFMIFGLSLVFLYSSSATYHLLNLSEKKNVALRRIDHMMIYLLIAGTYTPICLVALWGAWGWSLLSVIAVMALAGIILTLFVINKPRWVTVSIYITMGWMAVIAFVPIVRAIPTRGVMWIVAGGLFYSLGAVIYARKKPDWLPGIFGFHELWHLFVLAGSLCHYWVMLATISRL
jgi:hemolysin III